MLHGCPDVAHHLTVLEDESKNPAHFLDMHAEGVQEAADLLVVTDFVHQSGPIARSRTVRPRPAVCYTKDRVYC